MIIKLTSSKLFTVHPAVRFANTYKISPDIFYDLWRRYRLLDYSMAELCEIYYIKVGKPIKKKKMDEWIFKAKVYFKTEKLVKGGLVSVNSDFFGDLEKRLLFELFQNIKSGATSNIRIMA